MDEHKKAMLSIMASNIMSGLVIVSGSGYDGDGAWGLKVADDDLTEYAAKLAIQLKDRVDTMIDEGSNLKEIRG